MKILCQDSIDYMVFRNILDNLRMVFDIKVIQDMSHISKALNEVSPDLLLLKSEDITGIVTAYCKKNKTKLIAFGDHTDADMVFKKELDMLRPNINTMSFKDKNIEKSGISVFVDKQSGKLVADFLAKNYNVKIFGNVKINSPKYLGVPSQVEKYEILNSSKYIIDLGTYDLYDGVLLDTYPLVYTNFNLDPAYKQFDNLVSLTECLDYIQDINNEEEIQSNLDVLKNSFFKENSTTFTIEILNVLGFSQESEALNTMLGENINDWISN